MVINMKNEIKMFEKDSIEILHADSSHTFPLHSHECFCLGVVHNGRVTFKIGEQEETLSKGMIYLIPSNVGVTITPIERYEYTTICLKNELKDYFMESAYLHFFPALHCENVLSGLCEDLKNGMETQEFVESIAFLLRNEMFDQESSTTDEQENDAVSQAMQYIKQHVCEKFSLEELSDYVHISKYHLIRIFKKRAGVTPNQYYIQAKLYQVKQALKENGKETEVAAELNFADQSYLCNIFRKQMGISMKDFQENITVVK